MMKLLFYINTIESGGAERVIVNLCNQFAKHHHDVLLVNSFKANWEYELSSKVKHIYLEDANMKQNVITRNYCRIMKLRKIMKSEKIDVAISFMKEPNTRVLLASLGLDHKTIISIRNDPNSVYKTFFSKLVARKLYLLADGCVFQNEFAKAWFPQKIQSISKIIENQIDESFFDFNKDYTQSEGIVTVGRLEKQKNQAMLIESYNLVKNKVTDNLYIYGTGSKHDELYSLIKQYHLENRVFLMGNTHNVKDSIKNAKMFILTSNYEGMPNSLIEAMALGLPVISTDCPCGGPKKIIRNNHNGFIVKCEDIYDLSKKMLKLFLSFESQVEFGFNAKLTTQQYNPVAIYEKWELYVKKLVGERSV